MTAPLSPRALRARWSVARLRDAAARREPPPSEPVRAMGLVFPSAIGLASGFDRHGRLLACAHRLGLGSVEIGSFSAGAGATRCGPSAARPARCGLSLGKPAGVGWPQAEAAYLRLLRTFHAAADYVTLNPGRDCPSPSRFAEVVAALAQARDRLVRPGRPRLPIVAKLPPRWLGESATGVAAGFVAAGADGLLVCAEGAAVRDAHACLARLAAALGPRPCLISVGGIDSIAEVATRRAAGATLVQVHRALLTHEPALLRALRRPNAALR